MYVCRPSSLLSPSVPHPHRGDDHSLPVDITSCSPVFLMKLINKNMSMCFLTSSSSSLSVPTFDTHLSPCCPFTLPLFTPSRAPAVKTNLQHEDIPPELTMLWKQKTSTHPSPMVLNPSSFSKWKLVFFSSTKLNCPKSYFYLIYVMVYKRFVYCFIYLTYLPPTIIYLIRIFIVKVR